MNTPQVQRAARLAIIAKGSSSSSIKRKRKVAPVKKSAEAVTKKSKLMSVEDMATALNHAIQEILRKINKIEDIDYKNVNLIYQKFFTDYQDAFMFEDKPLMKLETDVLRMKEAPLQWTMCTFESKGKTDLLDFLMNMLDRSEKLCVMLNLKEKLTCEEDMTDWDF